MNFDIFRIFEKNFKKAVDSSQTLLSDPPKKGM